MGIKLNRISFIKETFSLIVYQVVHKRGLLRKNKTYDINIWHSNNKIYLLEIIDEKGKLIKKDKIPFDIPFDVGDLLGNASDWASDNGYNYVYRIRKGKGKHSSED